MKVRKAVIPVAGFGTRFLPATRSVPKNMLPVLDTPAIQYAVKEAVEAGIDKIVLVVSEGQEAFSAHFAPIPDLEAALEERGKDAFLEQMREISDMADISYVYQHEQLGLGHAVLTAREAVGDEPFAVFLPDDIIWSADPTIGKMTDILDELGGSVIAVREVPDERVPNLGIVDAKLLDGDVYEVAGLVEKPNLRDAPSNLAIIGRYVLTPQVFEALQNTPAGAIGEIQITDAISELLSTQKVYAYRFPGDHFDVGTPLGLLKASAYAALQREDLAGDFKEWLSTVLDRRVD